MFVGHLLETIKINTGKLTTTLSRVSSLTRPCSGHIDEFLRATNSPRPPAAHTNKSPQPLNTFKASATTLRRRRRYQCRKCGYEPKGTEANRKSNFKRHQESCQQPKRHVCSHPHCGKTFTRSDNLRVHQNKKQHFLSPNHRNSSVV